MTQMPVRLGIVGAGGFTRRFHIPNFVQIPGVQVVAVCNRSVDSGKTVAEEFGFDTVLSDWRELVHLPNIDAVIIGTWPYMHAEVAVEALNAGKHVFTEAHMAGDLEGARDMYLAAENNPHLKTMLSNLRVPGDRLMRQLLKDDYVGNLRQVLDYRSNDQYIDVSDELHWRQDRKFSGINFQYLGVSAEINRRWFGDHTGVFAQSRTFPPKSDASESDDKLPDMMNVLSEFEDGTPIVYLHNGVTRFSGNPRLEIYGDEGTLIYYWQNRKNAMAGIFGAKSGDKELAQIPIPPRLESNWLMNEDFIDMIRYDSNPSPELATFYDGLKYTEFTAACFKSLEKGTWVDLPLPW